MHVISGPASAHWRTPEKLRFVLAPIIAHSKAEQERFYQVFDQYYAELFELAQDLEQAPARPSWLHRLRTGWRRFWRPVLLIGTLLILGVVFTYYWLQPTGPVSIGYTINQTPIRLGDTTTFTLTTRNIKADPRTIRWRMRDVQSGKLEAEQVGGRSWRIPFSQLSNFEKTISVAVYDRRRDTTYRYASNQNIQCPHLPQLENLNLPINPKSNTTYRFTANILDETPDLQYFWDFGDNTQSTDQSPDHRYLEDGSYTVTLAVTRTDEPGYCTNSTSAILRVSTNQVVLPYYDLQYDPSRTRAVLGWASWFLLFGLGAATFYLIFRWAKTQRPQPPVVSPPTTIAATAASDRPPYQIPFRPLNGLIRSLSGQFRLADALRRRQEGLRQEVDIAKTLEATIDGGGFPRLQFRSTTRPADYLFLVDEQAEHSHQGRLLRHLVRVLHDQDVHAEVFYHRSTFFHCWNSQYPQGISLDQISRLYPEHRLIVFGDAHTLLDPSAQAVQPLRQDTVADFQRWKQRMLLSPRPPQSWDYREASIHRLLPVFPSDLEGQITAANFIDTGMSPEDLPATFAAWRERLLARRTEPDVNRRWRNAADHEAYFEHHPQLYRWFAALALYPTPTWEITLAIGAALDIPLEVDNLLLLARVPSLQEGKIAPRLRKELLECLDEDTILLAREAIAHELESALLEAAPGFANRATQSNLAVQRFALDPYSAATQTQVSLLLDQGWFNRLHIEDMGGIAAKALAPRRRPMTKGGFTQQRADNSTLFEAPLEADFAQQNNIPNFEIPAFGLPANEPTLRRFLSEQTEPMEFTQQETPPRPRTINHEFWHMLAGAISTLLLAYAMWTLDSTPRLYRWAFGTTAERLYQPGDQLRGNALVREALYVDSATTLNNAAVQLYREKAFAELQRLSSPQNDQYLTYTYPPQVRDLLGKAMRSDLQRYTAALNLARLDYNLGVAVFRSTYTTGNLEDADSLATQFWSEVKKMNLYFKKSTVPKEVKMAYAQLYLAAEHGLGLLTYWNNPYKGKQAVKPIHQALLESRFYDTTEIRPNLATILQEEPSRILSIKPQAEAPTYLEVHVQYYANQLNDEQLTLRISGVERRTARNRPATPNLSYLRAVEKRVNDGEGNVAELLQAPRLQPGETKITDSLRAELIRFRPNSGTTEVVARHSIPYRKVWGTPATTQPENNRIRLSGQVVAESRSIKPIPIPKASITLEWEVAGSIRSTETYSDAQGRYTVERDLSRVNSLNIKVKREGYEPQSRRFSAAELKALDEGRLPDFRLMRLLQNNIQQQQQQQ